MQLIVDPLAVADIEDIYAYSLASWGAIRADRYRAQLFEALDALTDYPELGRSLVGYPLATRVLLVQQHNVFYRVRDDHIRILRVSHTRTRTLPELH